jgi:hypothetical protein
MDVLGVTVNCGTVVIRECKDLALPWGEEWAFQALLGEVLDATGGLMNVGLRYAGGLSENLVRAINALRCALVNIGDNAWNLVAAVYWTLVGVGQEATVKEYLDIGYEWICTCGKDAQSLVEALAGAEEGEQEQDNSYAISCSEKAAVNKADAERDREEKRQGQLDAQAEEERIQEAEQQAEAARDALVGKSAGELEAAQLEAFEAYQAKATELSEKDAPSDEDKEELEALRRAYEATKTAKANIVRDGLTKQLWDARAANGLDGLRAAIRDASDEQLALAKKSEEFPGDVETANLLGAAETNILLLRDELLVMSRSTEVSVREAEGITEIAEEARAAEAYNRLYAEALPIARGGDQDALDIYFGAVFEQLREAEREYNWAVDQNKPDAIERGVELAEALVDSEAGLDVQYDVVDAADQESLLPEVVLTEDEEDALMFPIDAARSTEGGQADVTFRLMQLYDTVIDAEFNLRNDSEDSELQTALARAREEYRYTKEYAIDTAAQQEGATPEEIAAAERAASGEVDDGIEEVAIDTAVAEELERQIAEQRAEEQRIRLEAVAKAEEELAAAQAEADRLAAEEAAAAEAAAAAAAEKEQADALFALIEAQQASSGDAASSRRRLEDGERVLSADLCTSEFTN